MALALDTSMTHTQVTQKEYIIKIGLNQRQKHATIVFAESSAA